MKQIILFFFIVILGACTSDTIVIEEPECDSVLTYDGEIKELIDLSCATAGCHVPNGDGTGIYTTYQQLFTFLEDGSFEQSVRNGTMPPVGSPELSDAEKKDILCWIQNGYPEN